MSRPEGAMGPLLVALSGGVDSATAAGLAVEAGHELVGVFMRNGVSGEAAAGASRSCCSVSDARDARAVADRLGIPFYVLDLSRPFEQLIESFCRDYEAGRTPNPCVLCNNDLKFGELMDLADDLSCDGVVTGHYARLEDGVLRRAVDRVKDQSYLLHGLDAGQRARARFPLGEMTKAEVRGHARRLGLAVADKPDSADICFVPGGDYRAVLAERTGGQGRPGEIVDGEGRVLANHGGVGGFTVGQRRGLGVALGEPAFVTAIDPASGRVQVGPREALARATCVVEGVAWHEPAAGDASGADEERPARALVQLRHHHTPEPASLTHDPARPERVEVRFDAPTQAVTPGQYAVFYEGDRVLGGGRLALPTPAAASEPATEAAPAPGAPHAPEEVRS